MLCCIKNFPAETKFPVRPMKKSIYRTVQAGCTFGTLYTTLLPLSPVHSLTKSSESAQTTVCSKLSVVTLAGTVPETSPYQYYRLSLETFCEHEPVFNEIKNSNWPGMLYPPSQGIILQFMHSDIFYLNGISLALTCCDWNASSFRVFTWQSG